MLRTIVLLLLLLNSAYFAWSHGSLAALGLAPVSQREPQRLSQQVKPEAVRLLSEQEARQLETASTTPSKPPECLQAGIFDAEHEAQLRQTLEAMALPPSSWTLVPIVKPGRWIVYMGRFANSEALEKKRTELGLLKIRLEKLRNPALEPGLSLGGYETQAAANAVLPDLTRRGVRTARVMPELAEVRGVMLRLSAVDEGLRARLPELKPKLAGKTLITCR